MTQNTPRRGAEDYRGWIMLAVLLFGGFVLDSWILGLIGMVIVGSSIPSSTRALPPRRRDDRVIEGRVVPDPRQERDHYPSASAQDPSRPSVYQPQPTTGPSTHSEQPHGSTAAEGDGSTWNVYRPQ